MLVTSVFPYIMSILSFPEFLMIGAKQPNYLITADDVDTYLAIEVQPLDNRKRKVLSQILNYSYKMYLHVRDSGFCLVNVGCPHPTSWLSVCFSSLSPSWPLYISRGGGRRFEYPFPKLLYFTYP